MRIPSELIIKLVFEDVIFYTVEHNIGDNLFSCYHCTTRKDLLPIKMEMWTKFAENYIFCGFIAFVVATLRYFVSGMQFLMLSFFTKTTSLCIKDRMRVWKTEVQASSSVWQLEKCVKSGSQRFYYDKKEIISSLINNNTWKIFQYI